MGKDHVRKTLEPLLVEELTDDVLRTMLKRIGGLATIEKVACHQCGTLVPVPLPAVDKQIKAVRELGEFVHGRLPEQKTVEHIVRQGLPVDELTDAELDVIAEGKWEPSALPPAA